MTADACWELRRLGPLRQVRIVTFHPHSSRTRWVIGRRGLLSALGVAS